eukprot:1193853-Pyramimonas_sp.AAC.1
MEGNGRLVGWPDGRLRGCFVAWLPGWLVGWFVGWSLGRAVARLVVWLVRWSVGRLVVSLFGGTVVCLVG